VGCYALLATYRLVTHRFNRSLPLRLVHFGLIQNEPKDQADRKAFCRTWPALYRRHAYGTKACSSVGIALPLRNFLAQSFSSAAFINVLFTRHPTLSF